MMRRFYFYAVVIVLAAFLLTQPVAACTGIMLKTKDMLPVARSLASIKAAQPTRKAS
jgi:penicillin V acylase-like amidase (Ntn superfamily)